MSRHRSRRYHGPSFEFDAAAMRAYLEAVSPRWLAEFLLVEASWNTLVHLQLQMRRAIEAPQGPDLARIDALATVAIDPGDFVDEEDVSRYERHVDVVTETIAELTRRGYAKDAAEIGEMAEEEIEACRDRIHDHGTLDSTLDSLHVAIVHARDVAEDEKGAAP
jgi:hypothetical protein